MARRKKADEQAGTTATMEPEVNTPATETSVATAEADSGTEQTPKNWGPPYRAIYTNTDKGFELGENRRFKQRVFTFREKPDAETIEALKAAGFRYRGEEKAWTVQATAVTRELSDDLARQFAGEQAKQSDRGR
jgi:hypothetical protein